MANQKAADASIIRRLKIRGFRGCKELIWYPGPGLNVILGGGDVGKTTILDAISLLLSPTNSYLVTESDYFLRQVTAEFEIEAVFTFASDIPINQQAVMAWPWDWDGKELLLPIGGDDQPTMAIPFPKETAYCVRVRANSDLELSYEVRQPDGNFSNFSASLRRSIGLVRLGGDDRNDRDLRLVQGSALSLLLGDKGLRTRLGQELSSAEVEKHLAEDSESELVKLKTRFVERALPADLGLAITGTPGLSIGPLVGLTAKRDNTTLPLASWGAGTRRLAALTISDSLQDKLPITVIDEIERGLEPYRQRYLVQLLSSSGNQVFLTTHSAAAIAAAAKAQLWYLDSSGRLGEIPLRVTSDHQARDPETFLSKLTVVTEGATEFGFAEYLLQRGISKALIDYGLWITDAHGQPAALSLLEALTKGGLRFAGIVDSGESEPVRWKRLRESLGDLLLQWPSGCIEEHIISIIPEEKLVELITGEESGFTGARIFTLSRRLGTVAEIDAVVAKAGFALRQVIIDAAIGLIPDICRELPKEIRNQYKGDSSVWFKSRAGGRELAEKAIKLGAWPQMKVAVMSFINAIRSELKLQPIEDIDA